MPIPPPGSIQREPIAQAIMFSQEVKTTCLTQTCHPEAMRGAHDRVRHAEVVRHPSPPQGMSFGGILDSGNECRGRGCLLALLLAAPRWAGAPCCSKPLSFRIASLLGPWRSRVPCAMKPPWTDKIVNFYSQPQKCQATKSGQPVSNLLGSQGLHLHVIHFRKPCRARFRRLVSSGTVVCSTAGRSCSC